MTKYKKIKISLVSLLLILVLIGVVAFFRQGFYLINGATCYTETNAKNAMQAEIKLKGFCSDDCELRDKSSEFCPSDRPYVVYCIGGTQGTCGTDNRIDECPRGDIDCDSGYRCKQINTAGYKSRCYKYENIYCTLSGWQLKDGECARIGCQSDSECNQGTSTGYTCELRADKSGYSCIRKKECDDGEVLCIGNEKFRCKNNQWSEYIGKCEQDTMGGEFTSINVKTKVTPDSSLLVKGFFLPSASGKYYIEAGINLKTFQEFFIAAKAGQSCDGDKHFAGASKDLVKGKPEEFQFEILTPSKIGKYKLVIGAYPGCGKDAFVSKTIDIQVGEPEVITNPPTEDDPTEDGLDLIEEGDDCEEDYTTLCNDDSEIIVFKCIDNMYIATNEICEDDITGGDDGTGGHIVYCKGYQDMKKGECKFSFNNLITNSGLKDFWKDFTWYIVGSLAALIAITIFLFFKSKKFRVRK